MDNSNFDETVDKCVQTINCNEKAISFSQPLVVIKQLICEI